MNKLRTVIHSIKTTCFLKFVHQIALGSVFILGFAFVEPSHALLMKTTFSGNVTLDNGGDNPFGLTTGDAVSGMATWDDADVLGTSANEDISINGLVGYDFTITLGSFSFSQSDVTDPAFTTFWFNFGQFDGIEFFIEPIDIGAFTNLLIEDFDGGRRLFVEDATSGSPVYLELDWDFPNADTRPVGSQSTIPVPATVWLFGSGLMGLVGMARRKKA